MMAAMVPTLSTRGWLSDPNEKAQQLFAWFMIAEPSQSKTFAGNITSFSDLVVKHGKAPLALCEHTKLQLESYYGRYFDSVDVKVTEAPLLGETEYHGRYRVMITITAVENGVRINLMQGADVGNNVFTRVASEINNGIQY